MPEMSHEEGWAQWTIYYDVEERAFAAFAEIGHALWSLLLGLFGGGLALLLARRREAKSVATPPRK
jgi:hypothetical protein